MTAGRSSNGAKPSFASRLSRQPVVVEVVPPSVRAAPAQIEQALKHVEGLLEGCDVDAVNVPEVLGSSFQSMDPLEFGLLVHERLGVEVIVNKVVVHEPKFAQWIDRVLAAPIASAVLVGGERSGIYYPGPSVLEANRLARQRAEAAGRPDFPIGNITLPARPREALRMLEKQKAGCTYFTSQIIYEIGSANAHLQAYDDVCGLSDLAPRPVFYAFSPAATQQDILFLRYLGVHVPPAVEDKIRASPGQEAAASLAVIEEIWSDLLEASRTRKLSVPLGIIVETVSRHNAEATRILAQRLRGALAQAPSARPAAEAARRAAA